MPKLPPQISRRDEPERQPVDLEIGEEFKAALDKLENGTGHLFITGRAGTGKSTLLRLWRSRTKRRHVVLAPTGIAALNVGGQTIHSFFKFNPHVTVSDARREARACPDADTYRHLDTIVIDEASMLRADLVDCIDQFLRIVGPAAGQPFGGVRLALFGDLLQLPPVVTKLETAAMDEAYDTPFFFSAEAMVDGAALEIINLTHVYRQNEAEFIETLDAIRTGRADAGHFSRLAARYQPDFEPDDDERYVRLVGTNAAARAINDVRLAKLKGKSRRFAAVVSGNLPDNMVLPSERDLTLKRGAQVMFVANDPERRWVNGTMGRVTGFAKSDGVAVARVELPDGEEVEVGPHAWDAFEWQYDATTRDMSARSVGRYVQLPLRLAWAITIHKSQGQTFDRVLLDIAGGTFAPGQLYVALSRCRTLEGLTLKQRLGRQHLRVDWRAVRFLCGEMTETPDRQERIATLRRRLESAAEDGEEIVIEYRKPLADAERRRIVPLEVGEASYNGTDFIGVRALCRERGDERLFRIDRILKIVEDEK